MNLENIFVKLRNILKPHESSFCVKADDDASYYLEYEQRDSNAKPEMFAAVMIKKNYVSLYYMPVYNNPALVDDISEGLKKHMQGKSCFNFSNENDEYIKELNRLVKLTVKPSLKQD